MWKQEKLLAQIEEIRPIKDLCVISGGLAWHFMSPAHVESKYVHDHKDVDIFVFPDKFQEAVGIMKSRGFNRYWTKYDGITPNFYRYGKTQKYDSKRVKILVDIFLEKVPYIEIDGFKIVEPKHLLTYYKTVHTSGGCIAVREARILVARGINPVGREELIKAE